jgi:hypothetical protein
VILISRNSAKFCCTFFREIVSLCKFFKYQYTSRNFAKFFINYFAKLFRYVNFSNSIHKESILINIFWKSYQCSGSGKFWHGSGSSDPFPKKRILIHMYKCSWICDIKVIFLVVWKIGNAIKFKNISYPVKIFNFVTKISR